MANKIKDLKGFRKAVYKEYHYRHNNRLDCPDDSLEWLGSRIEDLILNRINEAEYINQWVKE